MWEDVCIVEVTEIICSCVSILKEDCVYYAILLDVKTIILVLFVPTTLSQQLVNLGDAHFVNT